ncbi:MAG: hypothetical protein AAF959_14830 [Cyanobacteria bacterium P01_D01_bin.56]
MFSYSAYGLTIESDIAIAEFPEAIFETDAQVTISLAPERALEDYLPEQVVQEFGYLRLTRTDAVFYIKHVGLFVVSAGAKILIIPSSETSEAQLRFYLIGTVMGILLYQRGLLVLHASAINIRGNAIAFLGVSGEGKSSAAAAFQAANYQVMTDDVAPVVLNKTPPVIIPGFPQIKLSLEVATVLGHDFESLAPLYAKAEKRGYRCQQFNQVPLPIHRIYVLASGPEFAVERLPLQEAVVELSRHSRPSTLFHKPDAQHFKQCTQLVQACPVYRLTRPRNLALLPELVHQVENHLSLNSPAVFSVPA